MILTYNGSSGLWEGQCDVNIYNESGIWIVDDIIYQTNDAEYEYHYEDYSSTTYYFIEYMDDVSNIQQRL